MSRDVTNEKEPRTWFRQRKNEGLDITAMRVFSRALDSVPRHYAIAASMWMYRVATETSARKP